VELKTEIVLVRGAFAIARMNRCGCQPIWIKSTLLRIAAFAALPALERATFFDPNNNTACRRA
jgi:hypothetical protein